jgi:transcriptional regulator with XRE-family HTH domain
LAGTLDPRWGNSQRFHGGRDALNNQGLLIPKGHIPINGELVRTKRILGGWGSPAAFADKLGMSEKRMIQIEKGGANVYAATLVAIAKLLGVEWNELIDETAKAKLDSVDAPAPTPAATVVLINISNIHDFDDDSIQELIRKIKKAAKIEGDISIISVEDGSIVLTLGLSEVDMIQLVSAFCQGKLINRGFTSMKLAGHGNLWLILQSHFEEQFNNMVKRPILKGDITFESIYGDEFIDKLSNNNSEMFIISEQAIEYFADRFTSKETRDLYVQIGQKYDPVFSKLCAKIMITIMLNNRRNFELKIAMDGTLNISERKEAEGTKTKRA